MRIVSEGQAMMRDGQIQLLKGQAPLLAQI